MYFTIKSGKKKLTLFDENQKTVEQEESVFDVVVVTNSFTSSLNII